MDNILDARFFDFTQGMMVNWGQMHINHHPFPYFTQQATSFTFFMYTDRGRIA